MEENAEGFWGIGPNSPAIDAAGAAYAALPQFDGIEGIDVNILLDVMGQDRPASISEKDLGANEYPHLNGIQALATEENTGPDYNTSTLTDVKKSKIILVEDLMEIPTNPISGQLNLSINSVEISMLKIDLYNLEGKWLRNLMDSDRFIGRQTITQNMEDLPAGTYTVYARAQNAKNGIVRIQSLKLVKTR